MTSGIEIQSFSLFGRKCSSPRTVFEIVRERLPKIKVIAGDGCDHGGRIAIVDDCKISTAWAKYAIEGEVDHILQVHGNGAFNSLRVFSPDCVLLDVDVSAAGPDLASVIIKIMPWVVFGFWSASERKLEVAKNKFGVPCFCKKDGSLENLRGFCRSLAEQKAPYVLWSITDLDWDVLERAVKYNVGESPKELLVRGLDREISALQG